MHASQAISWCGVVLLLHNVNGFPAVFSSIDPAGDIHGANVEAAEYYQHPRAEANLDRGLGHVSVRSTVPPKNGGSSPPVPQTPAKDRGKGKLVPPPTDPQTPLPATKGSEAKVYRLGKCGTELPGDSIKNKDPKTGKSPPRPQPKTPKPPKTPKARKIKDKPRNAPDDFLPLVSGRKVLKVCGVKVEKVEMIFPKYPSSGDATEDPILSVEWKKHMVAYNAMVIDPCMDDYKFGKKPHPISKTDGVYSYQQTDKKGGKPHQKDIWETEHVVDAQIVKLFFRNMFQMVADPPGGPVVERDEIPQKWVSSDRGKAETQDQCSYLEQFWNKRWAAPKENSAMKHLLSVYPGFEDHKTEMLLLPGRLNNKKAQLFGLDGHNVISMEEFSDMPFHQRIEELRELVLLIEYLNTPDVAKYFKALSVRIRDRLAEIEAEGDDAYMRQTDDWWFNKKKQQKNEEDQELKDADDGKYKSVKLASRWSTWINNFVQIRVEAMQDVLVELTYDLEKDWEDAKTYAELLAPAKKPFVTDFDKRLKALKTHNTVRVNLQSYLIGSISRPGTPVLSNPQVPPNDNSNPFVIPDRTKPQAGASTPRV